MYKFRAFETYGIFISIKFQRNLDREIAWAFTIDTLEDRLFTSNKFSNFDQCELVALKKAVEYLPNS